MSKTRIGIIICLVILFVLGVLFGYAYINDKNENTDVISNDFLTKNDYFKDKQVKILGDTIEIDDKVITKKNGYYLMDVKTGEDEFYCNFVGAVQSELGVSYDGALNVCLKTISGEVDFGVIHAEKQDDKTILTVNYNDKTKVITENLASFGDIVRLDDYVTINSSSIKINNISYGVTKSMNLFNLCGYVSGGTGALNVSVYDKNKSIIDTETYNVTKSGNFCVNFFDLNDDVYFYSFS